jgi:hypothetical protein
VIANGFHHCVHIPLHNGTTDFPIRTGEIHHWFWVLVFFILLLGSTTHPKNFLQNLVLKWCHNFMWSIILKNMSQSHIIWEQNFGNSNISLCFFSSTARLKQYGDLCVEDYLCNGGYVQFFGNFGHQFSI